MTDVRDLISRMADELDYYRQLLTDDRREVHALAVEARAAKLLQQRHPHHPHRRSRPVLAGVHQMTYDDLLPCPFCGSTNLRYEFAGSQGFIECNECGTVGPCDERAADPICDYDAAYAAWNRRAAFLPRQGVGQ